ncbi:uncharacterized protein [Hetaerina americana]|uniref:uncharacterized protein n=1 Tax=Hetaerina americana TaxID=62018 RepID=UPI003A7F3153
MSRLTLCAVAVLVALSVVSGEPDIKTQEDVIACATKPGDQVLSFLQIKDGGHNLGKGSLDVVYPPEGEPENAVINCIMIKDLKPEIGATASITNGTIGSTRVSIHLESGFTKGFSFSIKLLGQ